MANKKKGGFWKFFLIGLGIALFAFGWIANNAYSTVYQPSMKETPLNFFSTEIKSPGDWVKESEIYVYNDRIVINVDNPIWGTFTDTNSMDPIIDIGANSLEMKPENPDDVNVGDIISYESAYGIIIHRVIEKGWDKDGIYYIAKGDNNAVADPGKVRFDQIQGVVIGVIY